MERKEQNHPIARRIRERREALGWTQGKLAEAAGLDTNNLSRLERGQTAPTISTLVKISEALGVTPNDLLLESFDAPPELMDAEIARMMEGMPAQKRRMVMEYIRFVRQNP